MKAIQVNLLAPTLILLSFTGCEEEELPPVESNFSADEVVTTHLSEDILHKKIRCTLFDLAGKKFPALFHKNPLVYDLNVSSFPSGVYIIRIQAGDAAVAKSIVVN